MQTRFGMFVGDLCIALCVVALLLGLLWRLIEAVIPHGLIVWK
jgi:hypothetical protein